LINSRPTPNTGSSVRSFTSAEQPASQNESEEPAIDLRSILLTLWRGKWIIGVSTLIALILAVLSVSQVSPTYRAQAKVMFGFQRPNVTNMQNVLADQTYDSAAIQNQIEILSSTVLTERVINHLKLDENPRFNPTLQPPAPTLRDRLSEYVSLPPEITDLLGISESDAPSLSLPDPEERKRQVRLAVINNVLAGLRLAPVGQSRVIAIQYLSGSPQLSARIANTYAEQYIVDQLEAKMEATNAATEWLSERVQELRIRLADAEEAIEQAMLELAGGSGQSLEVTQRQLEALNASLSATTAERSRLQALHDRLRAAIDNEMDLGTISEFRASPLIQRYRSQEIELLSKRTSLQASVPVGHPSLKRIGQQIEEVRRNITEEAGRIISATFLDLQAAIAQEQSLIEEVQFLEQEVVSQTSSQAQIRQLEREAEASRSLYNTFLARLQETTAQEDLQEADARLLSPAEIPLFPERVAKRRTVIVITVIGTLIGIGLAFLIDRLNNTFRSPAQLETMTGLPVIGILPAIGSRMKRADIIQYSRHKPGSALVEAVRNLRTSILFSNIDKPPKVVMFTSSVPKEAKSTTSMLVAKTSQQMGKSTIIVDCDLRLPTLEGLVDEEANEHSLLSVLEGHSTVLDAVRKDDDTGLHILTSGGNQFHTGINAADILASNKFKHLIEELSETYDLVILDTPPALVVADARIVSRVADAVVYAVHYDYTPRGAVIEGLKDLSSIGAPIVGIIMTKVNEARASQYSYNGHSYYKGQYRDYYTT
jgi:polysaccharide biosynthesis transport protein